jgi:hypothetical protein
MYRRGLATRSGPAIARAGQNFGAWHNADGCDPTAVQSVLSQDIMAQFTAADAALIQAWHSRSGMPNSLGTPQGRRLYQLQRLATNLGRRGLSESGRRKADDRGKDQ